MFAGKKVIIFDMDGTLIDSVGIWNAVDTALIARIRTDGKTDVGDVLAVRDAKMRELSTHPDPYVAYCGFLGEKYGSTLSAQEIHDLRYSISNDYLENVVDYKPHADELIKLLHARGFRLAIATTTRRRNIDIYRTRNRNIISKANIDDYFSPVYAREDATKIKPHPEVYLRVMTELGVKPEECLVFEDSLIGIEAAKNAGIEAVAVYDKYADKDREAINALATWRIDGYDEAISALRSETKHIS